MAGNSPEWLPLGFTEKVKYKDGRKVKYFVNSATGAKFYSKKDVLRRAAEDPGFLQTPQKANAVGSGSSDEKTDTMLVKPNISPECLPSGWIVEEKNKCSGARKGSAYKVYIQLSSGKKFYSRAAVTRYLKSTNSSNSVSVPIEGDGTDQIPPHKSPQSVGSTRRISKRKRSSYVPVAIETFPADGLPSGWIKQIKTSKRGQRIRKDPYYIDPESGYAFFSKPDALRYVETKDIHRCAIRPIKGGLDGIISIEKKAPSLKPGDEKLSEDILEEPFLSGDLKKAGENSNAKSLAESDTKMSEPSPQNDESRSIELTPREDKPRGRRPSRKTSYKNKRLENVHQLVSVDSTTNLSTEQKHSQRRDEQQSDGTRTGSTKSKRRRIPSLPSRASKRIADREAEVLLNSALSEHAAGSIVCKVDESPRLSLKETSCVPPPPSDIELVKDAAENALTGKEVLEDSKQMDEVKNPPTRNRVTEEQFSDVASEKPPQDDSKRPEESQLCYDFGDYWSDPLDFALKTLRGEIPIDDNLALPGCWGGQTNLTYSQTGDGNARPPQPDVTMMFQNDVPASDYMKQTGSSCHPPPANSASGLGNNGLPACYDLNSLPFTDAREVDSPKHSAL